jgi:hypothetical protein
VNARVFIDVFWQLPDVLITERAGDTIRGQGPGCSGIEVYQRVNITVS